MAIPGNPKLFARDIAEGYVIFNRSTCKRFSPPELKTVCKHLTMVVREIRSEQIDLQNIPEVQKRNQRLQRANNALVFIKNYAKRYRIVL